MRAIYLILFCLLANISFVDAQKKGVLTPAKQEELMAEGMRYYTKGDYEEAILVWESMLPYVKQEAALHFYLAKSHVALAKPALALPHVKKANELSPYSLDYGLFYSELLMQERRFDEMITCLRQLSQYDESQPDVNLLLAQAYLWNEQGDLALEALEKANRWVGEYPEIIRTKQFILLKKKRLFDALNLGAQLMEQEEGETLFSWDQMDVAWELSQGDSLRDAYQRLSERFPSEGQIPLLLTHVFLQTKDFGAALGQLHAASEDRSLYPEMISQVALKVFELIDTKEKWSAALDVTQHFIQMYPDEPRFLAIRGDLQVSSQDFTSGLASYLQAARLGKSKLEVWARIIQLDFELNSIDSAIVHAQEALVLWPTHGFFHFQKGFGQYIKGDLAGSLVSLELAKLNLKSEDAWDVQLFSILGDVYQAQKRYRDSEKSFDYVLQKQPEDEHVLNNYSYYLSLRKERLVEAAAMSKKLVQKFPTNGTYLDTHAWVLYQQGYYAEALVYLELAVADKDPAGATVWEHLGDTLYQLKRIEDAVAAWKHAKKLVGENLILDKKIEMKRIIEN
jgi:tetratricopeptide (TPR) repeat protein